MLKTTLAALALSVLATAPAFAQTEPTPAEIVQRHMQFANAGNIDAMIADYADDAVLLTAGRAVQGKTALRGAFTALLGGGAGGKKPDIKPIKVWSEGDVGFVTWEMNAGTPTAAKGGDSFLVHHGKIIVQAVFTGAPPT
jgi:ketosteroid isomerase-like protein